MAYNTGNSSGSSDPRDLSDSSADIDTWATSTTADTHPDRLGTVRKTWRGMENTFDADQVARASEYADDKQYRDNTFDADQADRAQRFDLFLANSGYQFVGDYAAGIELTEYNQVVRDASGNLWRVSASTALPYTTTGAGLPEGGAFIAIGDADLAQNLISDPSTGQGALLVRGSVIYVDTIADLQALPVSELVDGQQAQVKEYYAGTGVGGGGFYWDSLRTTEGDGGTVFNGWVRADYEAGSRQPVDALWYGADPTGVTNSLAALQSANDEAEKTLGNWVASGVFLIGAGILRVTTSCDIQSSTLLCDGQAAQAVLVEAGPNARIPNIIMQAEIKIGRVVNQSFDPFVGWAAHGAGVVVSASIENQIWVDEIAGFSTGYKATSSLVANPHSYNKTFLKKSVNNKIGVNLRPATQTGYVNENQFYGGRFQLDSANGTNIAGVRHVKIEPNDYSDTTGVGWPNNNTFYSLSIEGDTPEYHIEFSGTYNTFVSPRLEATPPRLLVKGGPTNQPVKTGYNLILDTYGIPSTFQWTIEGSTSVSPVALYSARDSYQGGRLYTHAGSTTEPHILGHTNIPNLSNRTDTNWSLKIDGESLEGKQTSDTSERVRVDFGAGAILVGDGSTSADRGLKTLGTSLAVAGPNLIPDTDNVKKLGLSSLRWSEVFAGTGTINTSDAREKEQQRNANDAEKRVAQELKLNGAFYKWMSAVNEKGDNARWHYGWMAQEVMSAFVGEGLDAHEYGMFCYDEWSAELGEDGNEIFPAGNRYGLRMDQLLAFIVCNA